MCKLKCAVSREFSKIGKKKKYLDFEVVYSFWKMKEKILSLKKDREHWLPCRPEAL